MACNGNNHSPNCQCGWGGVFYGLGLTETKSIWQRQDSYTNPNARCPRCRASVYFYQSPYGGKVYFDEMGPPWPKHPCTDSFNASISNQDSSVGSKYLTAPELSPLRPLIAKEPGWFHTFCSNIKTLESDPSVTVFMLGEKGYENQLFSRIQRDQVDVLWPILLKRSSDRKHYEISTLKAKESEPSEFRFKAFLTVNDLINFENTLRLQNEISELNDSLPKAGTVVAPKHAPRALLQTKRPKLTSEVLQGVKEKKQKIKLEEREKRQIEEAARRAEKALKKAADRENFVKNSGVDIRNKPKPKVTKLQMRENKKLQQFEIEKNRLLNVNREPLKSSIELAFENALKKSN
jgi:hypothetical protein